MYHASFGGTALGFLASEKSKKSSNVLSINVLSSYTKSIQIRGADSSVVLVGRYSQGWSQMAAYI